VGASTSGTNRARRVLVSRCRRCGGRRRGRVSAGGGREKRWMRPPVAPTAPAVSSSVAAAAVVVGGAAGCRRGGGGRSGGCAHQWHQPRPPSPCQSLPPLWWSAARPGVGGGGAAEAVGAPTSGNGRARRLFCGRCRGSAAHATAATRAADHPRVRLETPMARVVPRSPASQRAHIRGRLTINCRRASPRVDAVRSFGGLVACGRVVRGETVWEDGGW